MASDENIHSDDDVGTVDYGDSVKFLGTDGNVQGEVFVDSNNYLVLNALNNRISLRAEGSSSWDVRPNTVYLIADAVNALGNQIKRVDLLGDALDSAPSNPVNQEIYLASPAWDPDGDGNGEYVVTDDGGSTWHEVVDLPNYT